MNLKMEEGLGYWKAEGFQKCFFPLLECILEGKMESLTELEIVCSVSVKVDKSTGCDAIPPFVLKSGAKEITAPLTILYNKCINEGKWPHLWKKGEWTPVFKRNDPLAKENYRPITVLPAVDKVFEQLVAKQITEMFDKRLGHGLTAYRKIHSCETTLITLIEHWKLAIDNKQSIGILSTDMSKAFDSLHPALLLSKLRAYGFHEKLIDLLRCYLY